MTMSKKERYTTKTIGGQEIRYDNLLGGPVVEDTPAKSETKATGKSKPKADTESPKTES